MESSIAEFLKRQIACELLPTSIMYVFDLLWKLWHSNINLIMFCFRCLSFCWTLKGPQKFRKSHWCVPFTATFSKRRKIGASWSERCDNLSCSQVIQNSQDFSDPGVEKQAAPGSQRVRNSYHLLVVFFFSFSCFLYNRSYLLGLLAMIKCSICSYQCDNWYVSNWKLACHINFFWGGVLLSLLKGPSSVALAWHKAGSSAPFGVTERK